MDEESTGDTEINATRSNSGDNEQTVESPVSTPQTSSQTQATIQTNSTSLTVDQVTRRRRLEECVSEYCTISIDSAVTGHRPTGFGRNPLAVPCHR